MDKDQRMITYFNRKGKHNTLDTLSIAKARALELGIKHMTIATSHAYTPRMAAEVLKGVDINIVAVGLSASFNEYGWDMSAEETQNVLDCGIKVCKAMHAFTGDVSEAFLGGNTVNKIVGDTLGIISQGTKVCVETAIMAAEAGLIPVDEEIIALAGTDGGADTALVMKANYARKFKQIQVLEILCKPRTPFV